MASRTLRRRIHHADVNGDKFESLVASTSDSLSEPLLGNYGYDDKDSERRGNDSDDHDEKNKAHQHWTFLFSNLIAEWAHWLANIVFVSSALVGRLFLFPFTTGNGHARSSEVTLSPLQEERLQCLQRRLEIPFDGTLHDHQAALKQLWRLSYPGRELPSLKSELWKEMGWQGSDPSTDFRGGGFISLENLIFFAENYPDSFQRLLHKKDGIRAEWEYPFAVAGLNISFMLMQMLDLQSGKPSTLVGIRFLELLGQDSMAFDKLYCIAFNMMDAQWLAMRASYMEFNDVLKSTRIQLERELALEDVLSVKDLPGYTLLILKDG